MTLFEAFAMFVAGANGGMMYWAFRRRERVLAWVKAKRR